ncbi:hypothetical protein QNI16_07135 [Cytophagaceae bacterium YF14B1]|uniref:Uncharacterized protein n=1 Tax=Xanthocytophaga flava TaxID=3048013 RepID=A0AAE3QJ26_9BACT|nr:hypothetical protein [Xanthocytophaga flavus]MDJ1480252.1 hypothetical protein [Xanthocytophaga flavus]
MTKKSDKPGQKLEQENQELTQEEKRKLDDFYEEKRLLYKEKHLILLQSAWPAKSLAHKMEAELVDKKIELAKLEIELEEKRRINNSLPPAEESK